MSTDEKLTKAIVAYSKKNGYVASGFAFLECDCGSSSLRLYSDDEQGSAKAICAKCSGEIDIAHSLEFAEKLVQNICNCDNEIFRIVIGTAYYLNTVDPRWIYVGCRCDKCELSGVYVDWQER